MSFEVLSSPSRLKIYRMLLRGPMSTEELARALNLSLSSLRFHLRALEGPGLVTRETETPKARGRPKILWKINRETHIGGFPVRRYSELSEILMRTALKLAEKEEDVGQAMFEVGKEAGSNLIRQISQSQSVSSWGPEEFCQEFIKKSLESSGIVTEIEKMTDDEVIFSHFSCPFEELAMKYTPEICDHLDRGFYEGIAEAMGGNPRFERTACLAHGDSMCSYVLRWANQDRGNPQGKAATPEMPLRRRR